MMKKSKEHQEGLFYVRNIFSELHSIYSRSCHDSGFQQSPYDKIVLQEVVYALQQEVTYWKQELHCSPADFYYAFNLPTNWDCKIREALIRPLFIKADLIQENDGQGRLIFFTELESTFRFMQTNDSIIANMEIKPGDQILVCSLDLQKEAGVNMELLSVHYPALTATDNMCVSQLLSKAHFKMALGLMELKSTLSAFLEERCDIFLTSKFIDIMLKAIRLLINDFKSVGKSNNCSNLSRKTF